jgi:hypothetical protein
VPAGGREKKTYGHLPYVGTQAIWYPGAEAARFADWLEASLSAMERRGDAAVSYGIDALLAVWLATQGMDMTRLKRDLVDHQQHPSGMGPGFGPPPSDTFHKPS